MDVAKREITLIAAASQNQVLGKDNKLIWHLPKDLKRFKTLTSGHCIIMGRKTFESLPKALPNRTNIVLTRNPAYQAQDAVVVHSVEEALEHSKNDGQPFILGGGEIYSLFIPIAHKIELTRIHHNFEGDAYFPKIDPKQWKLIFQEDYYKKEDHPYDFSFLTYIKTNP